MTETIRDVKDFLNGEVIFDPNSQYFWVVDPVRGPKIFCELRGWGSIEVMFRDKSQADAINYQDSLGRWIAEAINEKLEREKAQDHGNLGDKE